MTVDPLDARWFKSSFSAASGECVEAAHLVSGAVAVRDSKVGDIGPVLVFEPATWDLFNLAVQQGMFDLA
ncbi:DUF397 domain-containing protein [Nocardia sp. NBC_00511]|uniref:DUF397 domain-containing protein n=1 Tax=Nocardia sp. NBC_00511 TaxID=2903591 RepID=UPI0030E33EDD